MKEQTARLLKAIIKINLISGAIALIALIVFGLLPAIITFGAGLPVVALILYHEEIRSQSPDT